MICRSSLLVALTCFVPLAHGDLVTFDFGNANNSENSQNGGNGNWNPFPDGTFTGPASSPSPAGSNVPISSPQSITIDGLQMTILGSATSGSESLKAWGINKKAIGIHSNNPTFGGTSSRLDGSAGEAISFWFDQPVLLNTIRLAGLAGDGSNPEIATLTPDGGATIQIQNVSTTAINSTDNPLGDLLLSAGTKVTLTTDSLATFGSGITFSEITVTAVPEGSLLGIWALGACLLSTPKRRHQS